MNAMPGIIVFFYVLLGIFHFYVDNVDNFVDKLTILNIVPFFYCIFCCSF